MILKAYRAGLITADEAAREIADEILRDESLGTWRERLEAAARAGLSAMEARA